MKRAMMAGLTLGAGLLILSPGSATAQDAKKDALATIERMFAGLAKGDTAAMRAEFLPEGRVTQTGTNNGAAFYRVNPIDAFLKSIGGAAAQGRKLEEKIIDPKVTVEDNVAHVWSKYDFFVDGKKSHCGIDTYHVIKTASGWKLLDIVDTQRRPCS